MIDAAERTRNRIGIDVAREEIALFELRLLRGGFEFVEGGLNEIVLRADSAWVSLLQQTLDQFLEQLRHRLRQALCLLAHHRVPPRRNDEKRDRDPDDAAQAHFSDTEDRGEERSLGRTGCAQKQNHRGDRRHAKARAQCGQDRERGERDQKRNPGHYRIRVRDERRNDGTVNRARQRADQAVDRGFQGTPDAPLDDESTAVNTVQ